MNRIAGPLLATLLLVPPIAWAADAGPASTVRNFYTWDIAHAHASSDRTGIKDFVSAELVCLMQTHVSYHDAMRVGYPDIKPALVEFDYFSGFTGTPTRFSVKKSHVSGDTATVTVRLFADETGYRDPKGIVDTLFLRRHHGRWLITDVQFPPPERRRLLDLLYKDMSDNDPKMGWEASRVAKCRPAFRR